MMMLNREQREELKKEMITHGEPVRFMDNGRALNIVTGDLDPKGINVIHQMMYWGFTRKTSRKIAKWLGVKAVFGQRPQPTIIEEY